MVQEISNQVVPEELYNLTQLAEVTLAAGKLSTSLVEPNNQHSEYSHNNLSARNNDRIVDNNETIKYYTLSNESPTYCDYYIPSYVSERSNNSSDNESDKIMNKYNNYSSTKKKWKTNWENNGVYKQKSVIEDADDDESLAYNNFINMKGTTYANLNDRSYINLNYYAPKIVNESSSKLSSEDSVCGEEELKRRNSFTITSSEESEDSAYSYTHKIFDRKKSRSLSWNNNNKINESDIQNQNLELVNNKISDLDYDEDEQSSEHNSYFVDKNDKLCVSDGSGNADDVHICPECGKKYSTSSNLARHRQTHRSLQDKKARRCPHCDKVYVSMPAFSMHVRTHNQGCQCPHCGKCFSRPWLLQGHIRTHTGEKPFKCNVCEKAFADKSNLRAHVQTHSNTKPHACNRCGKAFALKSYLYKHEESSCLKNHLKTEKTKTYSKNRKKPMKISSDNGHPGICHQTIEAEMQLKKNAVKAKIREVLEDNSKKSKIFNSNPSDNRISVIRTTSQSYEDVSYEHHHANVISNSNNSSTFEFATNYAIVA